MEDIVVEALEREVIGKKVKALRREGRLPAILYGRDMDPIPISLDFREASRILTGVTSSSLIQVALGKERLPALVRQTQRDVILGDLLHVDFQIVSLTETVRANVTIQLEGEAPAVQDGSAILVTGLEEIELECLPQDLPSRIVADVSSLEEVGDALYVRDLALPEDTKLWSDPEELIVLVTYITMEEIEEEEEEEILAEDLEEPEVIERGKRDEEEQEAEAEE